MKVNFSKSGIFRIGSAVALTAVLAFPAAAEILTPEAALSRAMSEAGSGISVKSALPSATADATELVYTVSLKDNRSALYVFAKEKTKGFAILSASDRAAAVLGYSDNSEFDPGNIPPNMKEWLDSYAEAIAAIESSEYDADARYVVKSGADKKAISPMITTRWNQNTPYNDRTPLYNGKRSVTGCLATAEAQVLNYNKYPEKATGTITYKWTAGNTNLSCNFDTIPLKWDLMLDSYTNNSGSAEERLAVADLMLACGMASQMNYTSNESGATSLNGAKGLYQYMGCTQAGIVLGSWYAPDDLEDFVYDYISTRGPLVYCGQSDTGGHAFVCDGYSEDGYFHFNWGWGGMSDGYFRLNALNPGSQGIGGTSSGYNSVQQLMVGLHKPVPDEEWSPIMAADAGAFVTSDWNTVLGDTVMFETAEEGGGFWNFSMAPVEVTYGAKFVRNATEEVTYVPCYGIIDRTLESFRGWRNYPFIIPKDLAEGTYSIYAAYKIKGKEWKEFVVEQSAQTFTLATVRGDSILFEKPTPADIIVSDIDFETATIAGGGFRLKAKIQGTGDRKFFGTIAPVLGEFYGEDFINDFQGTSMAINAKPGIEDSFTYTGTFTNTRLKGKYTMVFIVVETGKIVSEPIEVTINPYPGEASPATTDAEIIDASAVDPQNLRVKATVTSNTGYFSTNIYLAVGTLSVDNKFSVIQRFVSPIYYILPGESETVTFGGAMASAEEGEVYAAQLQYYNPKTRKYIPFSDYMTFAIGKSNGVEDVTVDEDANAPAEYFTITGARVSAENLVPGTYIVRKGTKTSKIIIRE